MMAEQYIECPYCGSHEISLQHYDESYLAPECNQWFCENCNQHFGEVE